MSLIAEGVVPANAHEGASRGRYSIPRLEGEHAKAALLNDVADHDPGIRPKSDASLDALFGSPAAPAPLGDAGSAVACGRAYAAAKRIIDIVGSASALLVLSLLLLSIALAIRLTSRGPALYKQERYGRGGRVFHVLKFRTMHTASCDHTASLQTGENDPRITALGKHLRRRDLDELPQLINVLKGDMSLVGPRPHPVRMKVGADAYDDIVPDYQSRHTVRPGITGLAQVSGCRGPVETLEHARARQAYDLEYIRRMGLRTDLSILVQTIARELWIPRKHQPARTEPTKVKLQRA